MLYGLFGSITLSEVRTVRGLLATWLQAHLDVVVEGVTTVREWIIHVQGGDPNEAVARYLSALRGGACCGFLEMYAFSQIKAIAVKTYASRGSDFVLRMVASPEGEAKETRRLLFVGRSLQCAGLQEVVSGRWGGFSSVSRLSVRPSAGG